MGSVFSYGISGMGIIAVIALILAVAATVLAFIFIVPEKKRAKLNAFGKFLSDTLNFKHLLIERILQALYIFSTAYVILSGFLMLFQFNTGYYGDLQWNGGIGLILMIVGPIVIRLVYELLMMSVLLVKNVISINKKLANQAGTSDGVNPFAAPDTQELREKVVKKAKKEPVQPVQPIQPIQPVEPVQPVESTQTAPQNEQPPRPVQPVQPIRPVQPVEPTQTAAQNEQPPRPVQPVQPVEPTQTAAQNEQPPRPVQPVQPIRPVQPVQPIQPVESAQPVRRRRFCTQCGTQLDENGRCPNCGQ